MKVLLINVVCGIRSTGRICTDIATFLESEGHEVKIAYGRESVPVEFQKYAIKIGTSYDIVVHGMKSVLLDKSGFGSKKVTQKFIEWIKSYDPDVIHLHNIHGYYINIELLFQYLRQCGKKIIWTLHDCWAFTGHCSYFTVAKCEQWKTSCVHCSQTHAYPRSFFVDDVYNNFQRKKELFVGIPNLTIVTPSVWLKNQVKKSFLNGYNIQVIPNGIDLECFIPTEGDFRKIYHLENKKIILGVATAWSSRKGLEEFQELSKVLDPLFQIVLVGLNKKQIEKLPNKILKLGKTNSVKELAVIYTCADVFLNLGKEETMGMTTIEAMACGTPVVVSNLTAVPEVVKDEGGIILPDLSIESIVDGINRVIKKDYPYKRYKAKMYEKNNQFKQYLELFKK